MTSFSAICRLCGKSRYLYPAYAFLLMMILASPDYATASEDASTTKPWELTAEEFRSKALALSPGRSFFPAKWPGNAKVGVLLAFDVDNEALAMVEDADLFVSSVFQFGTQRGLQRILGVLDRHQVTATFFIPAMNFELAPQLARSIQASSKQHEFAVHGWIHERASDLSPQQQRDYFKKSIAQIIQWTGQKPVGYRAPYGVTTEHTIPLLQEHGFLYDSSLVADDVPYELLRDGKPAGLVELPPSLNLEDSLLDPMNNFTAGIQSPGDTLQSYKDAFDVAYEEGGMILILMHPHVSGKLSRIRVLEEFIQYAKSHKKVWFGTHRAAAEHFLQQLNQ